MGASQTLEPSGLPGIGPAEVAEGLVPTGTKRFWALVVAIGALAGLGAVGLVVLLSACQRAAWGATSDGFIAAVGRSTQSRRFWVPVLGGLVVTAVSLLFRQPLRGHGTAGIIESIWAKSGRLPFGRALLRGVVSIVAVALGAPLGREGALLQTGAASASFLGRMVAVQPDQARLLVACGASAGIAAAYNCPVGAALFGLEVLLGSFALELFGPIVVSCVVATLLSRMLLSAHPTYVIPAFELNTLRDVGVGLALGPVLGVASAAYVRVVEGMGGVLEKAPSWIRRVMPVWAMACIGAVAIWVPEILGNGYDVVNAALLGKLTLVALLTLPFLKMLATSLAAGAGVPGGLFTPSLFYGALLGGLLGAVVHVFWPGAPSPAAFAMMGMGAILAGTTHAPVSAVLIIFELTGNYGAILPLMAACAISAAVSRRLQPESLYTSVLKRRNVKVPMQRPDWLHSSSVLDLLERDLGVVPPNLPFRDVVIALLARPHDSDLYVAQPDGTYLGVIVLDDLKGHLPDVRNLEMTVAADVMDTSVPTLVPDASFSEVLAMFRTARLHKLPVLDEQGRLLGTISKDTVLSQVRL